MKNKFRLHTVLNSVAYEVQGIMCSVLTFKSNDFKLTFEATVYNQDLNISSFYNKEFDYKELLEVFRFIKVIDTPATNAELAAEFLKDKGCTREFEPTGYCAFDEKVKLLDEFIQWKETKTTI